MVSPKSTQHRGEEVLLWNRLWLATFWMTSRGVAPLSHRVLTLSRVQRLHPVLITWWPRSGRRLWNRYVYVSTLQLCNWCNTSWEKATSLIHGKYDDIIICSYRAILSMHIIPDDTCTWKLIFMCKCELSVILLDVVYFQLIKYGQLLSRDVCAVVASLTPNIPRTKFEL
jgi:hypothetical protein